MSSKCCSKSVRDIDAVTCNDCHASVHAKCVNLKVDDLKSMKANNKTWRCDDCIKKQRKSIAPETTAAEGELSLKDIVALLNHLREDNKRIESNLGSSVDACQKAMKQLASDYKEQSEKLDTCLWEIESLTDEVKDVQRLNSILIDKVDELEKILKNQHDEYL
ncbi:hypothetical protein LSTR_LSTR004495 [Laodelphax striatellus]|uniref:PHD-type domain-containing protein n=1 Tax=Laodelphax striatellus TaxID=195883 RepID=A0A482XH52_LAOST|nr:hypothetical protein LSTR_LSTR004495 [Laodelphax striatellus]